MAQHHSACLSRMRILYQVLEEMEDFCSEKGRVLERGDSFGWVLWGRKWGHCGRKAKESWKEGAGVT